MIFAIAFEMENQLNGMKFEQLAEKHLVTVPPPGVGRRVCTAHRQDRELVQQTIGKGKSRSARRTAQVGKCLGLQIFSHESWCDHQNQIKKLMATRRLFGTCASFGVAPDRSRISGKEYLGNSIYAGEIDRITWAVPKVT